MGLQKRLAKAAGDPERDEVVEAPKDAPGEAPEPAHSDGGEAPVPKGPKARELDPLDEVKRKIHQALVQGLGPKLYELAANPEGLEKEVRAKLTEVMEAESTLLSASDRKRLIDETIDDVLGYGPLEPLLADDDVSEVMVNGADSVFVERNGRLVKVDTRFVDEAQLRRVIDKIVGQVGRRIDEAQPYVDARLPDGSRVNAVIPPVALDGATLTIRKFASEPLQDTDLIKHGTMTQEVADFLKLCVEGALNVLVSGGTGAGKTTTLNMLSSYIPENERIITIEDAAELRLQQPHIVRLEYRPPNIEGRGEVSIRDLVKNALRMRPDRIVVGEVRGQEALDMLQAMNTGHDGSICTIHSNTPRDALSRLETMVLMAGVDLPIRAVREQIASAIQLIVHQSRLSDGSRRFTHVTEVLGMEGETITTQDIFLFDYRAGRDETGRLLGQLRPTGIRPNLSERLLDQDIEIPASIFTLEDEPAPLPDRRSRPRW